MVTLAVAGIHLIPESISDSDSANGVAKALVGTPAAKPATTIVALWPPAAPAGITSVVSQVRMAILRPLPSLTAEPVISQTVAAETLAALIGAPA